MNVVSALLNRSLDAKVNLQQAVDEIARLSHIAAVSIQALDEGQSSATFEIYTGSWSDDSEVSRYLRNGFGVRRRVMETKTPIFVKTRHLPDSDRAMAIQKGYSALAVIPLQSESRVVGLLTAARLKGEFASSDVQMLTALGEQFSAVLRSATIYIELERQAITDGLTGLYNRQHFYRRLDEEIERAKRFRHPLSLLFIDMDNLRDINDTFGHLQGDRALSQLADIIRVSIRKVDTACRYGGDEFAVILPETEGKSALVLAERLASEIAKNPLLSEDGLTQISISQGISFLSETAQSAEVLIHQADVATYQAKRQGKNKFMLFQEGGGPD